MTDHEVKGALSDFHAVWLTLYGEARSERVEGQIAVGCVIRNRLAQPARYGTTYAGVCLATSQFSCWNDSPDRNHVALMDLARNVVGDYAERTTVPDDPMIRQLKYLATGLMDGALLDRTDQATHYLTRALFAANPPSWARGQSPLASIGAHVFLKVA